MKKKYKPKKSVTPARPTRWRKIWRFASLAFWPLLIFVAAAYAIYPTFFDAFGQPGLPRLIDEATADRLITVARLAVQGQPIEAGAPVSGVIGAVVMIYGDQGPRAGAACFGEDAAQAIACGGRIVHDVAPDFGLADTDKVSIHLLRELRSAAPLWFREKGWGYSRGLYSVLVADGDGARMMPDTQMHVLNAGLEKALDHLRKKKNGVPVLGKAPDQGEFIIPTESYTEYQGKPVALYRASTILPPPTPQEIVEACKLGGDYLVKILQPNNKWLYEGDLGFDRYKSSYNQLRHAGAVYSLYQLFEATGVERYKEAADRGWQWVLEQIEREPDAGGATCAFMLEKHTKTIKGKKKTVYSVKLGGTGLALIALGERMKINRSAEDLELAHQLANHILRSQNKDGSFDSYWPYKEQPAKRIRSIYYPGEAMLGLVRLYQLDPQPRYLEAVEAAADYFTNERFKLLGMRLSVPPDAWLMLTLNELHAISPKKIYADYCETLTDSMLNDQMDRAWEIFYPDYDGGYYPYPPYVTPAGARMEGISACYQAMERVGRDNRDIRALLARAARFQIERIIRPEFAHLYPNPQRALGAFRHSPVANAIRIDYNQHNISGLLVTAKILEQAGAGAAGK
ncbi:MAG: hypothetical protein GX444_15945 [Myxococcales bacterium]|nr:hypothetical protein [Myxococcales bacterium]